MMNIGEMARRCGVSIRTLRHYDRLGLLSPSTDPFTHYRHYTESDVARMYLIRLMRELEFPLRNIARVLSEPDFNPQAALDTQIRLLTMRREHLDHLITQAVTLQQKGMEHMDFTAFDRRQQEDWAAQAKAAYGDTPAYQEFQAKENARHPEDSRRYGQDLMALIGEFGRRQLLPDSAEAQAFVQELRDFITAHYYTCTNEMLPGLADIYETGDFQRNIDQAGGPGTASSLAAALRIFCARA